MCEGDYHFGVGVSLESLAVVSSQNLAGGNRPQNHYLDGGVSSSINRIRGPRPVQSVGRPLVPQRSRVTSATRLLRKAGSR